MIQLFLSRYLYYDYDITPLVQQTIKQSLENIENVKQNYHTNEPAKERTRGLSSVFKSILSIPEKKKETLQLSEIKGVDLQISGMLETIMKKSPFDKLLLLTTEKTEEEKLLMKGSKEFSSADYRTQFRESQDDIFRKEIQERSSQFIISFNEVIMNIGDSTEGLRDMCFFLCKETSKSYVHLQTVLIEYHNLITLKEYLYAEMIIQHMQTALLKKDLIVAKGLKEDKTTTEQLTFELKTYRRELGILQSENRDLKLNIISLNETIEELSSSKRRLES